MYPTLCVSCGHPFVKWLNYDEMFELIFKKSIEAYDIFNKLMREDSIECEPIDLIGKGHGPFKPSARVQVSLGSPRIGFRNIKSYILIKTENHKGYRIWIRAVT